MACSTRPGPRACVQYVEDATGVHLTARDWHHLRALAEQHEGRKFSSRYADAEEVARVAADLVAKFPGDERAQAEFLREFTRARNTESTVGALDAMVQHDTLKDLEDRPRRVSAQQRELKAARGLSAPKDGYTTDMTPSTTPSLGDALQRVQDDYLKRMKEGYPDGELWIGGNPADAGVAPETSPSDEGRIAETVTRARLDALTAAYKDKESSMRRARGLDDDFAADYGDRAYDNYLQDVHEVLADPNVDPAVLRDWLDVAPSTVLSNPSAPIDVLSGAVDRLSAPDAVKYSRDDARAVAGNTATPAGDLARLAEAARNQPEILRLIADNASAAADVRDKARSWSGETLRDWLNN